MQRSVVIDTDTASDDAVAVLMALQHDAVTVTALTLVAGNVPVDYGVRNAKITLGQVGRSSIPIYRGAAHPLLREPESAQHVHGEDGMSGVDLEVPKIDLQPTHATLALLQLADDKPGGHTLVTLGPLTNVATALLVDPLLLTKFRHTFMMIGSSDGRGNVSPTGEFNSWADPEAAKIVLEADGEKTMIGWDVSRKYALITPQEDDGLRALGRLGRFSSEINQAVKAFATTISGTPGYDLPDAIAMAVALDESIITASHDLHMSVSTDSSTRGLTYADHREPLRPPNTRVVTAVDEIAFKNMLRTLLTEGPTS